MLNKFIKSFLLYEDINNIPDFQTLDTNRTSMLKIESMPTHAFLQFLREFLMYIDENGNLDLNRIEITEKIDGQAFRILTLDRNIYFESSYSGIQEAENVPMSDAAIFIRDNYSKKIISIGDYKFIGELLWISDIEDKNEYFTPCAASYIKRKLGLHGGFVILNILKVDNNKLVQTSIEEFNVLSNRLIECSDTNFKFIPYDNIKLNQTIKFNLNVKQLLTLLESPQFNKDRYISKNPEDAAILQQIEEIRANIIEQFHQNVDKISSVLTQAGKSGEGWALKFLDLNKIYGIFNKNYKERKNIIWRYSIEFETIYKQMFLDILGTTVISFRKKYMEDQTYIQKRIKYFNMLFPDYLKQLTDIYNSFNTELHNKNTDIPSDTGKIQISMMRNKIDKLNQIYSFQDFINIFILKN